MRRFSKKAAKGLLILLLVIAFWELLSRTGTVTPQILPGPSAVFDRWIGYLAPGQDYDPARHGNQLSWALSGEMPEDLLASLRRVLLGFFIGAGLALPLGLLMGVSRL